MSQLVSSEAPLYLTCCGRNFPDARELAKHKLSNHSELKCFCGEGFATENEFLEHIWRAHESADRGDPNIRTRELDMSPRNLVTIAKENEAEKSSGF